MFKVGGEFCHIIDLEHIFHNQGIYNIVASTDECAALSRRFGIASIESLSVNVAVVRDDIGNRGYFVRGYLIAQITQRSIVSLQDVHESIDSVFDIRVFEKSYQKNVLEEQENEQDIEFSEDSKIDIGEISAQYLTLSINPYPRLDGESFDIDKYADEQDNPFSKLQAIKNKP